MVDVLAIFVAFVVDRFFWFEKARARCNELLFSVFKQTISENLIGPPKRNVVVVALFLILMFVVFALYLVYLVASAASSSNSAPLGELKRQR